MLSDIVKRIASIPSSSERQCFEAGYDSVVNGANETNCAFWLFSSKEKTAAWEAGRKAACESQAAQHRVEPTAPAAKRNSRKSTGTVSSKRRGGSR